MDYTLFTPELLLVLFFVGFTAGMVDAIAGGGGLIALPALLFVGLPPQIALGTNKLQGSFGTFSAAYNYLKKGQVTLKGAFPGIAFTLVGATLGSCMVQRLNPEFIKPIIPFLLLAVFLYTLFAGTLGFTDRKPIMNALLFYAIFGCILGFYDGFFGPGTGSFWTVAFMFFLGTNMTRATGYTKVMNFTSNVVALSWFIVGGNVSYQIGLVMAAGQLLGARIGSNLAIRNGVRFIRPFFLGVIFLTIVRLMYTNFSGGA